MQETNYSVFALPFINSKISLNKCENKYADEKDFYSPTSSFCHKIIHGAGELITKPFAGKFRWKTKWFHRRD